LWEIKNKRQAVNLPLLPQKNVNLSHTSYGSEQAPEGHAHLKINIEGEKINKKGGEWIKFPAVTKTSKEIYYE
jgi:hypothetical protein